VASPFFDVDAKDNRAAAALCKSMARGVKRELHFCVPQLSDRVTGSRARLLAPKSLWTTAQSYRAETTVATLPDLDGDKNRRPWHAKMMLFGADGYAALMVGSTNFTCAGLGLIPSRNAEANLLTMRLPNQELQTVRDRLDALMKLRGDVVHRSLLTSAQTTNGHPVTKEDLKKAINFLKNLVSATEKAFDKPVPGS
jgi:hypothetical protein